MIRRFGLVPALFVLSGCAVLKVDVDVYKGALADQDHVGYERLVAESIAAQPLLVALRETYEPMIKDDIQGHIKGIVSTSVTAAQAATSEIAGKVAAARMAALEVRQVKPLSAIGYVPDCSEARDSANCIQFHTEQGRLINAILSLYEDTEVLGVDAGSGLVHGRAEKGIKSLADEWAKEPPVDGDYTAKNEKFDVLRDALTEFAQKILFFEKVGIVQQYQDATPSNGIRGQQNQYGMVVQAIGNAILNQADDTLRYDRFRRDQIGAAPSLATALSAQAVLAADREVKTSEASATRVVHGSGGEAPAIPGFPVASIDRGAALPKSGEARPVPVVATPLSAVAKIPIGAPPTAATTADSVNAEKPTTGPHARDVLDRLVDSLKIEYTLAVREGGAGSERSKNLAAALKVALDQRGGFARLRPAVAYLRTSYAISELQSDPGLNWKNELTSSLTKSIPLIGASLFNYDSADNGSGQRAKIAAALDKQSWQNINSVRVAGGGRTNYAISKDDVGNWYVKAYSSDPQDIIKSAKNLALFGLGGGTNSLLKYVSTTPGGTGQGAGAVATDNTAPTSRLDKAFGEKQKSYQDETAEQQANLLTTIDPSGGLAGQLKGALKDDQRVQAYRAIDGAFNSDSIVDDAAKLTLAMAKKRWDDITNDADKAKAKSTQVQGNWIIGALQQAEAFARQTSSRLAGAIAPRVLDLQKQVAVDQVALTQKQDAAKTAAAGSDQAKKDSADTDVKAVTETLKKDGDQLAAAQTAQQAVREIAIDQATSFLRSTIADRQASVRKLIQTVEVLNQVNNAK